MDILFVVGRVLFAFLFIGSGINHLTKLEAMTGYAQYKKVPAAKASVIISGLVFLLGGIGIAVGAFLTYSALVIGVVLLVTAFVMHGFWNETDPQAKQNEMLAFNKDLALAGAALALGALSAASALPLTFLG